MSKKKGWLPEDFAKVAEISRQIHEKRHPERQELKPKIDPNQEFRIKKGTEKIKLSLADLKLSSLKKPITKKEFEWIISIDENDDVPF
jgi:hypothetical protein